MNNVVGEMTLADAQAMAGMLVTVGRAVPPHLWVDALVEQGRADRESRLPHHMF